MRQPVRIIFLLVILFSVSGKVMAMINSATDTVKLKLVTAYTGDGTRIWGILEKETPDKLYISDFNIGSIEISKNQLKNIEYSPLDGKVIIETINGTSYFGELKQYKSGFITIQSELIGSFDISSNTISKITFIVVRDKKLKGVSIVTNPLSL